MNLETISQKDLNELERLSRELLALLRKTKLQNEPVADSLHAFELALGDLRRQRFDELNSGYRGY